MGENQGKIISEKEVYEPVKVGLLMQSASSEGQ